MLADKVTCLPILFYKINNIVTRKMTLYLYIIHIYKEIECNELPKK